jgi:hypothetical protein
VLAEHVLAALPVQAGHGASFLPVVPSTVPPHGGASMPERVRLLPLRAQAGACLRGLSIALHCSAMTCPGPGPNTGSEVERRAHVAVTVAVPAADAVVVAI